MLGHDFTAFYAAGHFAATHQFDRLYDIQAVKDYEQATGRQYNLSLGDAYGPYWNPPFYAWVFAPLSKLPYPTALGIWTLFNAACGLASLYLLTRFLPQEATWKTRALVPLGLLTSMPLLQCLSHGQNSLTSLLLLTATVTFWRAHKPFAAGAVLGLLFYKPQLAAIVAAILVLNQGPRALYGLLATGAALLLVTVTTMPGALTNFLHQLPANVRFMQVDHPYVWERHATLKAFFRLLLQGRAAGGPTALVSTLTYATTIPLGLSLLKVSWASRPWRRYPDASRSDTEKNDPSSLIAATIATMPLLMPFYFDYDLLLLALPATLYASTQLTANNSQLSTTNLLTPAFTTLYLWSQINPGIAGSTHFNLNVPLLATLATLLLTRAHRAAKSSDAPLPLPQPAQPDALQRAA